MNPALQPAPSVADVSTCTQVVAIFNTTQVTITREIADPVSVGPAGAVVVEVKQLSPPEWENTDAGSTVSLFTWARDLPDLVAVLTAAVATAQDRGILATSEGR